MNASNDLQKQSSGIQIQAAEKGFPMKRLTFILLAMCLFSLLAPGGSETYSGKHIKRVAPLPCPHAYNELNVDVWSRYVFTGSEWWDDRYVEADYVWRSQVTRHIGCASDFSWNFVDRSRNNFGMVRTGVNFAF